MDTPPYQSRGVLFTFMLAMTRNTDVLKKAQEEVDRVVGNERLPDFNDRESLPYINALLEEVYRWVATSSITDHVTNDETSCAAGILPCLWVSHSLRNVCLNANKLSRSRPSSCHEG